jgi:hypothetical protein
MTDTARPGLSVRERRRIEAELLAPVARPLAEALGPERARGLLTAAVDEIARAQGLALAADFPEGGTRAVARLWDRLAEGGALELEVLERSERTFRFRVTRCRYAEAYRAAGLAELGGILSCGRDRPLLEGFAPDWTATPSASRSPRSTAPSPGRRPGCAWTRSPTSRS